MNLIRRACTRSNDNTFPPVMALAAYYTRTHYFTLIRYSHATTADTCTHTAHARTHANAHTRHTSTTLISVLHTSQHITQPHTSMVLMNMLAFLLYLPSIRLSRRRRCCRRCRAPPRTVQAIAVRVTMLVHRQRIHTQTVQMVLMVRRLDRHA